STIEKDMDLAEAMAAAAGVRCRTLDVTADFFTAVGTTPFRELPYPRSCEVLADLRIARRHVGRGTETETETGKVGRRARGSVPLPGHPSARAAPRATVQACCWVSWLVTVPTP